MVVVRSERDHARQKLQIELGLLSAASLLLE